MSCFSVNIFLCIQRNTYKMHLYKFHAKDFLFVNALIIVKLLKKKKKVHIARCVIFLSTD